MKAVVMAVAIGALMYFLYGFMQQKKAEAKQEQANAAVRYAKRLKSDEDRAQGAVDTANSIIKHEDGMAKEAGDAQ